MSPFPRFRRAVGVGIAVAAATLSMTQVAHAESASANVPPNLVPEGASQFLVAHGKGVQIYTCDGAGSWGSSVPRATLTTDTGQVISHTKGPRWTAEDGSSVTAAPISRFPEPADFNAATAKDIQQLLLKVPAGGATGGGLLGATTFIQRLNTQGGTQPPTAECKAQTAGKVKEVPYQADYVFFK